MNAVDPQVDEVSARQIPGPEGLGLLLPLAGQPCDRRRREPGTGPEELLQGRPEVTGRQAVQVQQRQHLSHLRGLARPRRQDRRGKPLPLTGIGVDTLVVDPRRGHRHRARGGQHLTPGVGAVADHQPATALIELTGVGIDVGGHLSLQRRGQHLPGAVAHDLIQQRPTTAVIGVGLIGVVNYGEHGRTFPTSASTPVLIREPWTSDHPREGAPTFMPPHRGSSTGSDHCSPFRIAVHRAGRAGFGIVPECPRISCRKIRRRAL